MITLFKNWNFLRFLRLGMGLWIGFSAISDKQPIFGLIAVFFLIQALFNTGCGMNGSCNLPANKEK